jgi:hypothetical protein
MVKNTIYIQCVLRKKLSNEETAVHIAWIPSKFAVLNKTIKIRESNTWSNGWIVAERGASRSDASLDEYAMDHKKQRDKSDRHRKKDGRWGQRKDIPDAD